MKNPLKVLRKLFVGKKRRKKHSSKVTSIGTNTEEFSNSSGGEEILVRPGSWRKELQQKDKRVALSSDVLRTLAYLPGETEVMSEGMASPTSTAYTSPSAFSENCSETGCEAQFIDSYRDYSQAKSPMVI